MTRQYMRLAAVALAGALLSPGAMAAGRSALKVGAVESDQSCSLYETYWGAWLVLECQSNFPELRDRLQSAVAESGKLALSAKTNGRDIPRPDYLMTGRVSGLGLTRSKAWDTDYCIGKTTVSGTLDIRLRNSNTGAVVFGGSITKSVEVGSNMVAGSGNCSTNTPARASYAELQRELALAAVRAVSFQLVPLRVTQVQGRRIALNYGTPFLTLGSIVQLQDSQGFLTKYRVNGATTQSATAEPTGNAAQIAPGAVASFIEKDDPAANGRRFEKVDLPG